MTRKLDAESGSRRLVGIALGGFLWDCFRLGDWVVFLFGIFFCLGIVLFPKPTCAISHACLSSVSTMIAITYYHSVFTNFVQFALFAHPICCCPNPSLACEKKCMYVVYS